MAQAGREYTSKYVICMDPWGTEYYKYFCPILDVCIESGLLTFSYED